MRKIYHFITTALLLLVISISGLLYVFYDVIQFVDKSHAENEISSGHCLKQLTVARNAVVTGADDGEIWLQGELYDVDGSVTNGDSVTLTVYHDEHEENLVRVMADSFEPNYCCVSDHGSHIVKHRFHQPDDGKVLCGRVSLLPGAQVPAGSFTASYSHQYCPPDGLQILKPPPEC